MAKSRKSSRRRKGGRLVRLTLRRPRLSMRRKRGPREERPIRVITESDYAPVSKRTSRGRRFLLPEGPKIGIQTS